MKKKRRKMIKYKREIQVKKYFYREREREKGDVYICVGEVGGEQQGGKMLTRRQELVLEIFTLLLL